MAWSSKCRIAMEVLYLKSGESWQVPWLLYLVYGPLLPVFWGELMSASDACRPAERISSRAAVGLV